MQPAPATPEKRLEEIRRKQRADRKRIREIEQRMKERGEEAERWRREDQRIEALEAHGVRRPWLVVCEAERAEAAVGGLDLNFVVVCLAVLRHETGIPQRDVFGCDHGPQGGQPPYCGDQVTHDRGVAFLRALHSDVWRYMNGVSWPQTTWYEKVFRVEKLSRDLTDPQAHLRVCLGDLAVLVENNGLRDGCRAYNGSGPAAEAYADAILNEEIPTVRGWLD